MFGRSLYIIFQSSLLAVLAAVSGAEAGEVPGGQVSQVIDDHPLLVLCLIGLLCAVIAVLYVSRRTLTASERRYRALFEDNGAVMFLVDQDSLKIMDVNPAACVFYGWNPAEFLTKRLTDINMLPEEIIRENNDDIVNYEKRRFYTRHKLASGEIQSVEVNSMPYNVDGREYLFSIIHPASGEATHTESTI